ncbi:MAG: exonuclease domain-containing protein [Spirochaetes bacterium]|nr:exonuclease domain-containing protein [Spirochaetota bacterium]
MRTSGTAGALAETVFVAFDTETTGLIAGADRIVELAAVVFRGDSILREHEQLVDPGIPIPAVVQAINNISDEMVRGMPPIQDALPAFLAFLCQGIPVAHNAPFDVGFLCPDIERFGLQAPDTPVLDTRGLARKAFPGRQSYSLDRLARELCPPERGGTSAQRFGASSHRALADAYACAALFKVCLQKLSSHGPLSVEDLVGLSGPRLGFLADAPRMPRFAAVLDEALRAGALVQIQYMSSQGERTVREIRPLSFAVLGGAPAISAFCSLRNETRTFRLDAIQEIRRLP